MRQLVPAAEQLSPTLVAFAQAGAGSEGLLRRLRHGDRPLDHRLPGASASCSATTSRPSCGRSTRSCATSTRSSPASTSTNTRSPRRWPTSPPPPTRSHLGATGKQVHYLRTLGPFSPESLATFSSRNSTNRNTAYSQPLSYKNLAAGLLNFHTSQCSSRPDRARSARKRPKTRPSTPGSKAKAKNDQREHRKTGALDFYERLKKYALRRPGQLGQHAGARLHASRRPSSRSTAVARRPPTSTPSNRANSRCKAALFQARAGLCD